MAMWTEEQMCAIREKDCNLLVAAAAGAGKTAVLVERIIRKITDPEQPVDIDRLLVVTFTNAAAAEMKERIAAAISLRLENNPGSHRLQRQLTLLSKAHITTIHSFCLEVIRSNFQHINIDPNFRIADETEAALMKLEVLERLFEDIYENEDGDRDFFDLLECYGGNRDDQAFQDMVLYIYTFIQSSPWPEKWLEDMTRSFNINKDIDFGTTPWGKFLLHTINLELSGLRAMMEVAVNIISGEEGLEKNIAVFREDISGIDKLLKIRGEDKWDALCHELKSMQFGRLFPAGKNGDKVKNEKAKKIRDKMKERIKKMGLEACSSGSSEICEDLIKIYPLMKRLSQLVKEFGEKYQAKKSRKGLADFNDLEHFCLKVLTIQEEDGEVRPSLPALAYKERFEEILVDEYQDSNLVQEYILKLISREDRGKPNVFMVGDVKQSIYRFRQAKPELFLEKYNTYLGEEGHSYRRIQLYKNFRSRLEVVQGVNFIFKQIMSVGLGELDYNREEALNPGADYAHCDREDGLAGGAVELHLIETEDKKENQEHNHSNDREFAEEEDEQPEEDEEMPDKIQLEARYAAKRIKELMLPDEKGAAFCVWDKEEEKYRAAEYRDVVILLRTTRKWSDIFMEELTNQGIPAFADTGTGFFKSPEIQVILSLLQLIDNPLQDIPLLAVLRSPLVSFTTDELAELRLSDPKGSIYDALQVLNRSNQSQGGEKASRFLQQLHKWRQMSYYLPTDRLIWHLYQETGYYSLIGAMPGGEQRQANLRILFERARQFEATSYKGLFNFINFVDKIKSSQGDMGAAKIIGENNNVVRIMSIHKSKGLEFPVVILAGCGKKFNLQDLHRRILLHQDLGFGPEVVDYKLRISYPSHPKLAIREKIRIETLSEEMRILYVALTRAKEKLIITGAVKNLEKVLPKWGSAAAFADEKIPPYELLKGDKYLDWIVPSLLRHKDGCKLRELGGLERELSEYFLNDDSSWEIGVWSKSNLQGLKEREEQEEEEFIKWLADLEEQKESRFSAELTKRLGWEYQYGSLAKIPAKVSVTELKRWLDRDINEGTCQFPECPMPLIKKPMFLQGKKGLTRAEIGTVMHFVMQHLDYRKDDLEGQLEEMVAKDLLRKDQADCVETGKIRDYLASPLGRRLLAAESVYREVPFFMEIPCKELYPDLQDQAAGEEKILLQGVIDCYFEESDGIVLLDYKTDYVTEHERETIRERYRMQISYYARALEMLTGKRVKDKYIYLFHKGEILTY